MSRHSEAGSEQSQRECHDFKNTQIDKLVHDNMQALGVSKDVILKILDHVIWGGDETCFQIGMDGTVRIIYAAANRKIHETLGSDIRLSIMEDHLMNILSHVCTNTHV